MKPSRLISFATLAVLAATGCNKPDSQVDAAKAELEKQVREARESEAALRTELELQKLNAERDAIALERQKIDDARADLERRNQEIAEADLEKLRQREEALANREAGISDRESGLGGREQMLNEREMELAGRESIPELDPTPEIPDAQPVSDYNVFYDQLSNDGSWFETPDYGYVWQPTVVVRDTSWRPYTVGRWACSNRGWTWMSDERFGWATYHYGRWALCRGRGWVWIPGEEWAPAWVCWRSGDSHVGWAPLPPESMCHPRRGWGTSVEIDLGISTACFNFVSINLFGGPIRGNCLPFNRNREWCGLTRNITNITYQNNQFNCGGLSYRDINHRLGRPMPFYQLNVNRFDNGRPGLRNTIVGNQLNIFAPTVNAAWNGALRPASVRETWRDLQVERAEGGVQTTFLERFRAVQAERKTLAAQAVEKLGGQQALQQQRLAVLEQNRQESKQKAQVVLAERQASIKERQQATLEKLRIARENQPTGSAQQQIREKQEQNRLALEQRQKELREQQEQAKLDAEARRKELADRKADGTTDPASEKTGGTMAERLRQQQEQNRLAAEERQKALQEKQEQAKLEAEKNRQEMLERQRPKVIDPTGGPDPLAPTKAEELQQKAREAAAERQRALAEQQEKAKLEAEKSRQEMPDRQRPKVIDPTGGADPFVPTKADELQQKAREAAAERQRALAEQQEKAKADAAERLRQTREQQGNSQMLEQQRQAQEAAARMKEETARRNHEAQQAQQERAAQMEAARQAQQEKLRQAQEERQRQVEASQQQAQMAERQRQAEAAREAQQEAARRAQQEQQQQMQERARQQQEARAAQMEQARQQAQERAAQQEQARQQMQERAQQQAQQQAAERARAQEEMRQRQQELQDKLKERQQGR